MVKTKISSVRGVTTYPRSGIISTVLRAHQASLQVIFIDPAVEKTIKKIVRSL